MCFYFYSLETYGFSFRTLCLPKIRTHAIRHPLGKPPRRRPLRDLDTSFRNPGNEREDRSCWGATLKTSGETMPWVGTFETVLFWSKSLVILNMILQMPSNALLFFSLLRERNATFFFGKPGVHFLFCMRFLGVELEQRGRLVIFPYIFVVRLLHPYRQYLFCCRCTQSSILSGYFACGKIPVPKQIGMIHAW